MEINNILSILEELTFDFINGKRNRIQTVRELRTRIDPDDIYEMPDSITQKGFITEIYVSLDNLTTEGFTPSLEEIKYFAECFEGQRVFSREEVRQFTIGHFD